MEDTDKSSNCSKPVSPEDKDVASAIPTGAKPEGTTGSGGKDNLEDFLSTLKQQITSSDWLQSNTAEKWEQENPDLAKQFKEAMKKS